MEQPPDAAKLAAATVDGIEAQQGAPAEEPGAADEIEIDVDADATNAAADEVQQNNGEAGTELTAGKKATKKDKEKKNN